MEQMIYSKMRTLTGHKPCTYTHALFYSCFSVLILELAFTLFCIRKIALLALYPGSPFLWKRFRGNNQLTLLHLLVKDAIVFFLIYFICTSRVNLSKCVRLVLPNVLRSTWCQPRIALIGFSVRKRNHSV